MGRSIEELRRIAGIKLAEIKGVKEVKLSARTTSYHVRISKPREHYGPTMASTNWR